MISTAWVLLSEQNVVVQRQPAPPPLAPVLDPVTHLPIDPQPARTDGWHEAPDWVCAGCTHDGTAFAPPVVPLGARQESAWERIKAERTRRLANGVRVGQHWFHTDATSQRQQLGLVIAGAQLPPGMQWKTLTADSLASPVYVTMTPTLAGQIFAASMQSEAAIHAAAEAHRAAMLASSTPESYECAHGWPLTFGEA